MSNACKITKEDEAAFIRALKLACKRGFAYFHNESLRITDDGVYKVFWQLYLDGYYKPNAKGEKDKRDVLKRAILAAECAMDTRYGRRAGHFRTLRSDKFALECFLTALLLLTLKSAQRKEIPNG